MKKEFWNGEITERLYKLGNYTYVHAPVCKGSSKVQEFKGSKVNIYEQLKLNV